MTWLTVVAVVVVASGLAALVVVLAETATRPAPADVAHFLYRHRVVATPDTRELIGRYLHRTRRYRALWAGTGIVTAVAVGISWYGRVHAGAGVATPVADLALMGIGMWFLGIVHAEAYNNRPRYHGPRTASLEPRARDRYRNPRSRAIVRGITVTAAAACTASLVVAHDRRVYAVAFTVVVLAIAGVATRSQRSIVHRARVVTRPDLQAADEAIRAAAAEAVDLGGAGALLVVTAWQLAQVSAQLGVDGWSWATYPALATVAALVGAAVLARRARRVTRPSAAERLAVARSLAAAVPDR